jgi:antirestriction protein
MQRLTGQELLKYCSDNAKVISKVQLARGAGYIREDDKAAFTDFYTARLEALGINPNPSPIVESQPPNHGVYIACLASYNNGILYGKWIDLDHTEEVEDISSAITQILLDSPTSGAEEYACHDWVGVPHFIASEYPDWHTILEYLDTKFAVYDEKPYEAACDYHSQVLSEEDFSSIYYGYYDSESEFCQERADESGLLESQGYIISYVDWEQVWNGEYNCNGWTSIHCGTGCYIFSPF